MQLVEEATEGCWIGHRARIFTSEIGSVYSPPKQGGQAAVVSQSTHQVETVIDIGHSENVSIFTSGSGLLSHASLGLGVQMREGGYSAHPDEPLRQQSQIYYRKSSGVSGNLKAYIDCISRMVMSMSCYDNNQLLSVNRLIRSR